MIYRVQNDVLIKNTDFIRIGAQRGFGAQSVNQGPHGVVHERKQL